jgi:hypothetical protein
MTDEIKVHVVKDHVSSRNRLLLVACTSTKLTITSGTFVAVVWYNHGSQQK